MLSKKTIIPKSIPKFLRPRNNPFQYLLIKVLGPALKRRYLTTLIRLHLLLLIQLGCTSYTLEAWKVLFWEKVVDNLGNLHEWRGADIFVAEDKTFEWGSL
jgi:hypothetical protein